MSLQEFVTRRTFVSLKVAIKELPQKNVHGIIQFQTI